MSTSKHTPSPWKVGDIYDLHGYMPVLPIDDEDGNEIAQAIFWPGAGDGGQDESRANARLIAAAPIMLEALEAAEVATAFGNAWANNDRGAIAELVASNPEIHGDMSEGSAHNILKRKATDLRRAAIKKARGE